MGKLAVSRYLHCSSRGGSLRAVLFDIDGTLLTEMPLIQLFLPQVYERLAKKLGISKGEARNTFLSEIFSRRDTYDWHDWNFFFELFGLEVRYEDLLRRYPHKLHVYPDTVPTLEWLKGRGYLLGVVTSGPEYQRLKLQLTGLADYFDVIVTREDVKAVKPEPRIFLAALESLGIEPREAAYVGDSLSQDVYGAKHVGMKAVWINRSGEKGHYLADYEIRTLHELRKILGGLE
jgi:putative hydrolase of the HAD superfamily